MAEPVLMPKQGQSVETCIITQWYKKKGDQVKKGDLLFAYETDKASFEEESQFEGTLLDVFYEDGDEVPVLVNVAVIGQEGEDVDQFRAGGAPSDVPQPGKTGVKAESMSTEVEHPAETPVIKPGSEQQEIIEGKIKISPRAKKLAGKLGIIYNAVKGTGPAGRIIERDIEAAAKSIPAATPLAQEMAKENNLTASQGTGVGGRITSDDLVSPNTVYGTDFEDKPLSNIRKLIARSMHASLQNSAQLTHHMSADVRKLQEYRKKVKSELESGQNTANITLNDMICFCVVKALKKFAPANSHFLGDTIRTFQKVHLGIAVDTPRGLMVPVLKNADDLSLQGLSGQLKAIAEQCKTGSIDPELLASTAASFTISNLGNYGVELFTPVINLPQVGILGVNTIQPKPKDLGGGVYAFVPHIGLSLTYDHRALDGAPATLFLKEIKEQIENFSV